MAFSKYNWKSRKPVRRNTCKAKGCFYPAWKGGYCKCHQFYVTIKTPIPKYKKKKVSRTASFGFNSQMEMFQDIIYRAPRPIICPVSGRDITNVFRDDPSVWVSYCAHVLPKGKYPLFKLYPGNMLLIDREAHRLYDQGTEAQRRATGWNFNILYELRDKLKTQYENYRQFGAFEASADETDLHSTQQGRETQGQEGDDDNNEDADAL